jgi:hypothetical protein
VKQRTTLLWLALFVIVILAGVLITVWMGSPGGEEGNGGLSGLRPNATPTIYASAETVIRSVTRLSRLETVSYRIEKVITAETGQGPLGFLFGDRLLLIAHGEVIAGVDLAKLTEDSVATTADGTIYMQLPPVEVFVATLNNEQTSVYDRRTGVVGLNPELETDARREAVRLILEAAVADGLEAEAEANAQVVLRSFLLALGFEDVVFVDVMPTPTPEPTPTASDPST